MVRSYVNYSFLDGKEIVTMAEKNSIAAEKYRNLSTEQKQHYHELASSSSVDRKLEINKWHETKRVLNNMNHNVSTIKSITIN